jgi:hypothetical protein
VTFVSLCCFFASLSQLFGWTAGCLIVFHETEIYFGPLFHWSAVPWTVKWSLSTSHHHQLS